MATAAAVRIAPQSPLDDSQNTLHQWSTSLQSQETVYEVCWKSQFVEGVSFDTHQTTADMNDSVLERALESASGLRTFNAWPPREHYRYDNPTLSPSIIGLWAKQGGTRFQKFFSRTCDARRFLDHVDRLPSVRQEARLRGQLAVEAAIPLCTLPNKPERVYTNDTFQFS